MQSTGTSVRASPTENPIVETYEAAEELTKCPPDGEDCQEVLVLGRDKLCRRYIGVKGEAEQGQRLPRKTVESTGKLPPTPMLNIVEKKQRTT